MGYVLTVYNEKRYREFFLSEQDRAEQELLLLKQEFVCGETVRVRVKKTEAGWQLLDGTAYTVWKDGRNYTGIIWQEQELLRLTLRDLTGAAMLIQKRDPVCCIYEKLALSGSGQLRIGKDTRNEICYDVQNCVSGEHAILEWRDGVGVLHDISRNGVYINHSRAETVTRLQYGDVLWIMGLKLVFLGDILAVDASIPGLEIRGRQAIFLEKKALRKRAAIPDVCQETVSMMHRMPRSLTPLDDKTFEIEGPPKLQPRADGPWYLTLGPSLTMTLPMVCGCLLTAARNEQAGAFLYTGLVTALGSALIGAAWGMTRIAYEKRRERTEKLERSRSYQEYLVNQEAQIKRYCEHARAVLGGRYPSAAMLCAQTSPFPELWSRNPGHEDFLFFRLGLGERPFPGKIEIPKERFSLYPDVLTGQPERIRQKYESLQAVPVGLNLREHGLVGLVGGEGKQGAYEVAREILIQAAYGCSYTEVKLVLLYDASNSDEKAMFSTFRWLPHTWSGDGRLRFVAGKAEEVSEVACALERVLRVRLERIKSGSSDKEPLPYYLVFVSDRRLLKGELLEYYLQKDAFRYGISMLILAEQTEDLPNDCEFVVSNQKQPGHFSGLYRVQDADMRTAVKFDVTELHAAERFVKNLANLRTAERETGTEIPERVTFFQLYQVETPEQLKISERWSNNRSEYSLRALIGQKEGGMPCFLDLHEKYHGPHGLLAGTTGSGKSETLQTLILSLAISYSPTEVAFFLIDYKGGGMANLFSGLPHLAGQISNLSGHLIQRAMISIKSENRRRQRIFAEYGVNNISAYLRLYHEGEAEEAIPHLFLIIDEFAELKREEPDFMRELVSVAQVGRSLGLHLILATQKPGGTVDDNIWSNARFRLCLRVQDRQDSNDMLHHPDAAYLTQAGRCYLQVGNDEIYEQLQTGFCGARWEKDDCERETVQLLTATGQRMHNGAGKKKRSRSSVREQTQLQAVVEHLHHIAEESAYLLPRRLWLSVLPERLMLSELPDQKKQPQDFSVSVGLLDDPERQLQLPLCVDFLHHGGLLIIGGVGSGKSTVLQTIVYGLIQQYTAEELHIYGMDLGNQSLQAFEMAPQVGGMVLPDDSERIGRCFRMLKVQMEQRKKQMRGGTYEQYRLRASERLPAILLLIDDYSEFRERTENRYEKQLVRIAKEGISCGIYLIVTAAGVGMAEIPMSIARSIRQVLCLSLPDRFQYMELLRLTQVPTPPEAVPGRGLWKEGERVLEGQVALPVDAEDDYERLQKLRDTCAEMANRWTGAHARGIPQIPDGTGLDDFLQNAEIQALLTDPYAVPFGYDMDQATVVSLDLRTLFCWLILGRAKSGKQNLLQVLAAVAQKKKGTAVVVDFEQKWRRHGAEAKADEKEEMSLKAENDRNRQADGKLRYLHTDWELYEFLIELQEELVQKNQRKKELEEIGCFGAEQYSKIAELGQTFFIILNLAEWIAHIRKPEAGVPDMAGFLENITEKGEGLGLFFFAAIHPEEMSRCAGDAIYRNLSRGRSGVCLGGDVVSQTLLDFSGLSYQEQKKQRKPGIALLPPASGEEQVQHVKIPLAV